MNHVEAPIAPSLPAPAGLRRLMECLVLAMIYGGTARLSQMFAIPPGNISPVWLPSGIALAAVLLRGYRLWPGIFLGAFLGNIWAYFSAASAGVVFKCLCAATANSIGAMLSAVVAAWLIQWPGVPRNPLHRASGMIKLIGYGGVLGTGISAVCGVGSLGLAGILPWSQSGEALWTWWIGDGMGVIILTPMLLAWRDGLRGCRFGREELAATACLAAFGLWLAPLAELPLSFLALPLLMWVVCRCDSRVALSLLAAFAAMKIGVLALGRGPFQGESQNLNLINLQLLLATFIAPLLILHAAFSRGKQTNGGERPTQAVFVAIGLLLAAGIVATGALYYRNLARKARAAIELELVAIAQFKVDQLAQYREARLADGRVFFHNPAFAALARRVLAPPADADACLELQTWLGKYQSAHQYNRVFLLDSQGVTRVAVSGAAEPVTPLVSQQAAEILRADRVALQDFYRNEHDQNVYLAVMVPIFDESQPTRQPLGVLVLRIDPGTFLNPLIQRRSSISPTAETVLLRRDGNDVLFLNNLRFRPDAALNLRVSLQRLEVPAVKAALGHAGFFQGIDYRGVPALSAALAVPDSPWCLVTKVDTAEADGPMHRQFWQVLGVVGILLCSVTGGAGMVWWQQLDRFHRERAAAADLLNTSDARFRQLFETNVMPVAFWNTEGLFTDANDAWCKVIDVDPGQVRAGKVSWLSITPPEMQARDLAAIREIQAEGKCLPYEKDFIRPDGSRVTVLLMGGSMLVDSPTDGVAFAVDLTERKQYEAALHAALAEKVVLLKEIHHRVKNNLQIVSSLLRLQSGQVKSADAKTVLLEMQDRVRSMALIHEHLYRSDNLAAVDLAAYLGSLCSQLVRSASSASGTIQLQMNFTPVLLDIDKAIPCGLLVNELVTNALKYAFPHGRRGVLRVDLQPLVGSPGWLLRVADDGVGLPPDFDLQNLTSLGLKLTADLARQLGGRLDIGSGPGAVFEVELPSAVGVAHPPDVGAT